MRGDRARGEPFGTERLASSVTPNASEGGVERPENRSEPNELLCGVSSARRIVRSRTIGVERDPERVRGGVDRAGTGCANTSSPLRNTFHGCPRFLLARRGTTRLRPRVLLSADGLQSGREREIGDAATREGCKLTHDHLDGIWRDLHDVERSREAYEKLRRIAEQPGEVEAQWLFAEWLDSQGRASDAVEWFRAAAESGHAVAMVSLGHALDKGRGVRRDAAEACRWYALAADEGESTGAWNLALSYEEGTGVEADAVQARAWFERAAARSWMCSWKIAEYEIFGIAGQVDPASAVRRLVAAVEEGDFDEALFYLGFAYETGLGVAGDLTECAQLYREAIRQSDPGDETFGGAAACARMGRLLLAPGDTLPLYERGSITDAVELGFTLVMRAAVDGYPGSMVDVAFALLDGRGTEADPHEAERWVREARATLATAWPRPGRPWRGVEDIAQAAFAELETRRPNSA